MSDIKRDFLYQFNESLQNVYSDKRTVVSVLENIENGNLKLSATKVNYGAFLSEVNRCIFIIKKILSNPYTIVERKQSVVPVSQAQNVNQESIKLTTLDSALWSMKDGKRVPKDAYSQISEDSFINYENAFIYQLIILLISYLKSIRTKLSQNYGVKSYVELQELTNISTDELNEYNEVCLCIKKLSRISKEKVFADNCRRVVNLSNIYVTDILMSDKRYNFCYNFFCKTFRNNGLQNICTNDFRVLYYNYSLIQLLYQLSQNGYNVKDNEYYIATTGKIFVDSIEFDGKKKLVIIPYKNGVDIKVDGKFIRVEFSKYTIKSAEEIENDYNAKIKTINQGRKYSKIYVTYSCSLERNKEGILNVGYNNKDSFVDLIKTL